MFRARKTLLAIFFLLLPTVGFSTQSFFYSENNNLRVFRSADVAASVGSLTYEAFYDILKTEKPKSIEELLSFIHQRFPYQFYFSTAMYTSLSLQEATYDRPRIIVYGPLGDFVFSFNSDSSQRGGAELETYQFKHGRRMKFREIKFGEIKDESDIKFVERFDKFAISEENPKRCTVCHGESPRPIWASYPFWPGAYGSDSDHIGGAGSSRFALAAGQSDVEGMEYESFLKNQHFHPRYQYFVKTRSADFLPSGLFGSKDPSDGGNLFLLETLSRDHKNTYLTEIVVHQVVQLFLDELMRKATGAQMRHLLSFIQNCQLSEGQRMRYESIATDYVFAKSEESLTNGDRACADKGANYLPGVREGFYNERASSVDWASMASFPVIVFAEKHGIKFSDFSPTLPRMSSGFMMGTSGLDQVFENALLQKVTPFQNRSSRLLSCSRLSLILGL